MIRILAIFLCLSALPVSAQQLELAMPVDCTLGQTCFIQKYVDRDPGPDYRDFGCGKLANDGHRGTDIALYDHVAMEAGVDVKAAADGIIRATRDGMPDILVTDPNAPDVTGRSCGNAVIVDHPDGWQTRYCHMKQGSIRVKTGMAVSTGTVLGQIGLSGRTEFPHLHMSVFKDGELVDPFQPDPATECGEPVDPLWADPIEYVPSGIISAGFSPALPEFSAIKEGSENHSEIQKDSPALVLWTHIFGGRQRDVVTFEIIGPQGPFHSQSVLLKRTQSRLFRASGRRLSAEAWPPGTYQGITTLVRDGAEIDRQIVEVLVTD